MMDKIAIVVVGYNRPKSMSRLLNSLNLASYLDYMVDLVISIDYSGDNSVSVVADEFAWKNGEKMVIKHKTNLGLFRHILLCGDLTQKYENVIILEDDLIVSPEFFKFSLSAIKYFSDDSRIAGISLYSHSFNFQTNRHFVPVDDGYDNFFIQMSQSWGQIWSKTKWNEFKLWLSTEKENKKLDIKMPNSILHWPNSSWMKLHNRFLVDKNYYFVYPRVSLTTNFSEVGTHRSVSSTCYQVPLQISKSNAYNFVKLDHSESVYDIFFENQKLHFKISDCIKINENDELTVNLFGEKKEIGKYELTSLKKNSRVLVSFGRKLRPHELNVIFCISGEDIFLARRYLYF